jgi:hypothetical protein
MRLRGAYPWTREVQAKNEQPFYPFFKKRRQGTGAWSGSPAAAYQVTQLKAGRGHFTARPLRATSRSDP